MDICLERGADLHMAQLMPLPLTVSCFSKIQIGFTFLVPAHPGSPGQRAVKWVHVCVNTTNSILGNGISKIYSRSNTKMACVWKWQHAVKKNRNRSQIGRQVWHGFTCRTAAFQPWLSFLREPGKTYDQRRSAVHRSPGETLIHAVSWHARHQHLPCH